MFSGSWWVCLPKSWSLGTIIRSIWDMSLCSKIKEHEAISIIFFTLVALCMKLNDEFMCLTDSPISNAKLWRQYMQEGRQKVEATGSWRYHNTLWKKMVRIALPNKLTASYVRFLAESPHFFNSNSGTQLHTVNYWITEAYLVLKHWWVVYAILLLCWSTACFNTLLGHT